MSKTVKQAKQAVKMTDHVRESASPDLASGREIMQAVLSRPRTGAKLDDTDRIHGVVIGKLSVPAENGQATVVYPGSPVSEAIAAISTVNITDEDNGSEVALSFQEGNPMLPVILGLIQTLKEPTETAQKEDLEVAIDGHRLTMTAEKEIVLKCGKASITLTRAGKIIVKGAYLSNHATGVNRIKGGSVQIN